MSGPFAPSRPACVAGWLFALCLLGVSPATRGSPVPLDEVGALAGSRYSGGGLAVEATAAGARLGSVFQRLEGEATVAGLWVSSTAAAGGRLRLVATSVGRGERASRLDPTGRVAVHGGTVMFSRRGVVEEYSTSVDGLRQDFIVAEREPGAGMLRVELALEGARAQQDDVGMQLAFEGSGRILRYGRLRVTDAAGRELAASMAAIDARRIAINVEDGEASYPVRIDPTFSDANWSAVNTSLPGANATVLAAVADGSGNVYVGGQFTIMGNIAANRVAKWNGTSWSALGTGMDAPVRALAIVSSDVYAAGEFQSAGGSPASYIARWNGSAWSALGAGVNGVVNALAASGSDLYVGGQFTGRIARWDGAAWQSMTVITSGAVNALAASGTDVYAGGTFTSAGGVPGTIGLARWDGTAWSAVGGGVSTSITALAADGADLYVAGGNMNFAGPVAVSNVAKWDGTSWTPLGTGVLGSATGIVVSGSDVFVGGGFSSAGGVSATGVARWNGTAWSALGTGLVGGASALVLSGGELYVLGEFTAAGGLAAHRVAKWNGSAWSALATGMDGSISALAIIGTDVYAGGTFTSAGAVAANRIARWDGSAWSALGSGMDGQVRALQAIGSDLYAGGTFTTAGGVTVNGVARWSGGAWSALAGGTDNAIVTTLAAGGSDLYIGGNFTSAGGVAASRVARWDGSAWHALGSGVDSLVMSLAVDGSNVYVGGIFSSAGGVPNTLRIAKWDGSAWSALGTGAANQVNALLVVGTDLYAGGQFFSMGGVPGTQFIARWDGTSWSALGGGMGSTVHALAYRGGELYAGGGFTTAGGVAAARIAKWDGAAWSALGTGLDSTVSALVRDASGHLLVGGSFALAGATVSPFVAQANLFYLEGLDMTGGSLSPAFADTTLAYTASVPNAVSSITLLPTAAQGDATITVNGSPVASGAVSPPIALAVGSNTVTIVLTAADGVSTRTYTVDVTRAAPASNNANLAGLALSSGTLAPAFAPATTSYAASVPFSVSSITVTPTAAEANATIQVNGVPVASGNASAPIALGVGASGITTVVTAQDGTTTRIYTVIVTRAAPSSNAELSGLALSQGTLMPAFASATTAYAATVADAVASLTVTPTAADSGAIIRVNGTVVASGSASGAIALGFGANTLTVLVTAADGITARSYTLQVTRDAGAATVYNLVLEGWQQVSPYVLTAATGAGTATYYAASRQLSLNLAYSGLSSAETAAHIHGPAPRGANAAALVTLSASNPKTDAIVLTSAQEAMLLAGQLYVNVHTSTHPNGEIRAQVDNLGAVVKRQLTVARAGSGSGRVSGTAEPGPVIDCGSDCVEMVPNGRVVALTATPAAGSTFAGWSGACTGSGACNVTLDAARTVTATFDVANPPRLANISTRVQVLTGDDVMIGGFIIGGSSTKTVLVRARGPSLSQAGVTGVLADPRLQLFSGPTVIASNDDWGQAANAAAILASGFAPSAAAESAILMNLAPGAYTAIVSGAANGTGVAIVEVFEVDEPGMPLLNISTRGRVQTGDNVMIGGFIIQGDGPQTVVVRARGPSLVQFAVPGVLANPQLTLFSGQTPIAGNDDWVDASNKAAIEASGFAPANSREAAILVTLQPGAYTAIVSGVGETTGVAIVEVFRN